ncbi:Glyceraldehyde-3-phosphate dehydrogenase 1 [Gossypium arboreum]|uniref:Glyceraldehyde-3-phosphate dehydrogenase 1 n=1 Tax=Gossypium arboreum TaxID=29729 RepID=A0A0B0P7T0_GOSAR|nr:Glyceraldehyde-3-phosphate dehydrogenase 1 [Gossypium arboreum]
MSLMPSHHMPPLNPVIHHARRESSTLLMPYAETHSLFNIRENKRSKPDPLLIRSRRS